MSDTQEQIDLKIKKKRRRRIMDYLGAFFLSFFIVFIWQLYRAPISIPFVKPYIVKALSHDSNEYEVSVENVDLELVRSIKPIRIIAKNVMYKKIDDSIIVTAPRTTISFSLRALTRGVISPSSVVFDDPNINIFTKYSDIEEKKEVVVDKKISDKKIAYYLEVFDEFIERFSSSEMIYAESYIDNININNAQIEVYEVDIDRKWLLSEAYAHFNREDEFINLGLSSSFILNDGLVPFSVETSYNTPTKHLNIDFGFTDLIPSTLLESVVVDENKNDIYKVNMPFSGKISTIIDFGNMLKNKNNIIKNVEGYIKDLNFTIEAGEGSIAFSDDEKYNYNISNLLLSGSVDGSLDALSIKNSKLNLDNEQASISVDVKGLKKLIFEKSLSDFTFSLKADIKKFELSKLSTYWPRYIAEIAWDWCKNGLVEGSVSDASFGFDFSYDEKLGKIAFDKLTGVGYISNAKVDYLEGMPIAQNVYGKAVFSNDKIDIIIDKGNTFGIDVNKGQVVLYDLDKNNQFIKIVLSANSKAKDALAFIDHKPFEFAKEMGVKPDTIEGNSSIDLDLGFELKTTLKSDEIKLLVKSELTNISIKDVIKGKSITSDKLSLLVNNRELKVSGNAIVDDIAVKLDWLKEFNNTKYENKYNVSLLFNSELQKKLSIESDFLKEPYLYGDLRIDASIIEYKNSKYDISLSSNLTPNKMAYDFIGFDKSKGENGRIVADIKVVDSKVSSINNIKLTKSNFVLDADLGLDKNGDIKTLDVKNLKSPRTNARGKFEILENKGKKHIKANISGSSYDVSWFLDKRDKEKKENREKIESKKSLAEQEEDSLKSLPSTDVFIAVDSLWTNKEVPITNFAGSLKLVEGIGIHEIKMVGNYAYKKEENFKFNYVPRGNGAYKIDVLSSDAGSALKVLRIYPHMQGGGLNISANADADGKILGHAKIRNFSIKNTSLLYRLLSMTSFSGIVDMLKGGGIQFSHLDAPFSYEKGVLEFDEAKAFGNVVGITTTGFYNFDKSFVNVKGLIAPAYGLNKMLGKIPVLGNLLSGKDGTVFAVNYRAKGDVTNPVININPLSVVSPNSMKELFESKN